MDESRSIASLMLSFRLNQIDSSDMTPPERVAVQDLLMKQYLQKLRMTRRTRKEQKAREWKAGVNN